MEFLIKRDDKKQLDELEHTGVDGMHWYVRQWQDKAGHLTDAGRERYRKMRKEHNWGGTEHSGSGGKFGGSAGAEETEAERKKREEKEKQLEAKKKIFQDLGINIDDYDPEKLSVEYVNYDGGMSATSKHVNMNSFLNDLSFDLGNIRILKVDEIGMGKKPLYSEADKHKDEIDKYGFYTVEPGDQRPYRKEYNPSLTGTGESALASKWKGSNKAYDTGNIGDTSKIATRDMQATKVKDVDREKLKKVASKAASTANEYIVKRDKHRSNK